jgi:hypothetical protein
MVECDEHEAEGVAEWLKTAMMDGLVEVLAPVPVEVEVSVSRTWSDLGIRTRSNTLPDELEWDPFQ